jgi:PhzF family phenazine biosynthesis protein
MRIPLYQVDAFTREVFQGNPAAVCPLSEWLPEATMQAIAAENNLAETAFFVKTGDRYHLRWFTPAVEVDLCGHATLASAYVITRFLEPGRGQIPFDTLSGELNVLVEGDLLSMDFPTRRPEPVQPGPNLLEGLGGHPKAVLAARDYMVVYGAEHEVAALEPDFARLRHIDKFAVIVTAPGKECDFVSRFFAPGQGIDEDPVTGSAHCTLIPYWADRLGKLHLKARQISRRGGELDCELKGARVKIAGHAALYLTGHIEA